MTYEFFAHLSFLLNFSLGFEHQRSHPPVGNSQGRPPHRSQPEKWMDSGLFPLSYVYFYFICFLLEIWSITSPSIQQNSKKTCATYPPILWRRIWLDVAVSFGQTQVALMLAAVASPKLDVRMIWALVTDFCFSVFWFSFTQCHDCWLFIVGLICTMIVGHGGASHITYPNAQLMLEIFPNGDQAQTSPLPFRLENRLEAAPPRHPKRPCPCSSNGHSRSEREGDVADLEKLRKSTSSEELECL